jgi:hypothetical protein
VYQVSIFSNGKVLILLIEDSLDRVDDRKGHVISEIPFLPVPGLAVSKTGKLLSVPEELM